MGACERSKAKAMPKSTQIQKKSLEKKGKAGPQSWWDLRNFLRIVSWQPVSLMILLLLGQVHMCL